MPPKRQRARRGASQKATAADPAPGEPEGAEPNVESPIPQPEVPEPPAEPVGDAQPTSTSEVAVSARPIAMSASPAPATVGGPAQRGRKLLSKPRGRGRRSQAQLQQLQQAEDESRRAEAEGVAARDGKRRADGRGRGRGSDVRGRGRGGYMGERDHGRETTASGFFGSGQASREEDRSKRGGTGASSSSRTSKRTTITRSRGRGIGRNQSQSGLTTSTTEDGKTVKQESGPATVTATADGDNDVLMLAPDAKTIDISSDEEDGERRLNVEDLGVVDLTQDEPFAPVRVLRVAHKERAIGINADGATNQDGNITIDANDITTTTLFDPRRGKQKAREAEIVSDATTFQATYSDSESDAERRTKVKRDPDGPDGEGVRRRSPDVPRRIPSSSPDAKRKAKEKVRAGASLNDLLPSDQDYQTRDELDEWERHQSEVKVLREELGAGVDYDGDATMVNSQGNDKRAEKVYLFQFPPVLPDLSPIVVKPDPETTNANPEGMQIDQPITIPDDDSKKKTRTLPNLPSGAIGKLKVHASGRVTMDWGGTSLRLGMGTRATFLQDILVAQLPESKNSDDEKQGLASSMGQVKGKFVVTPDWEEILK